jgi:hypothetical protein
VVSDSDLQLAFTVFGGYNTDLQGFEVNNLTNTAFVKVVMTYGKRSEDCLRHGEKRQRGKTEAEVYILPIGALHIMV